MFPTIQALGIQLSAYTVIYGLAVLVGGALAYARLARGGLGEAVAARVVLGAVWGGIAGAVGGYGLLGLVEGYLATGLWRYRGGSAYMGALVGGAAALLLVARWSRAQASRVLDLGAPSLPLGQAIGRIGCLARGCCYGQLTDGWLGCALPDVNETWLPRYPTQLLSAGADLAILLALLAVENRWGVRENGRRTGALFALYLALYGLKRFAVEFLRGDAARVRGPFTQAHIAAGALSVCAVAWLAWARAQTARRGG